MAIAAWKRFENTPQWQRNKRFLKHMIGKQPELRVEFHHRFIENALDRTTRSSPGFAPPAS